MATHEEWRQSRATIRFWWCAIAVLVAVTVIVGSLSAYNQESPYARGGAPMVLGAVAGVVLSVFVAGTYSTECMFRQPLSDS